jgi:hypothetical protein
MAIFHCYTARNLRPDPADLKTTGMRYQKSKDKYIELGQDRKYVYAAEDKMVFPRVWDPSNDQNHADYYAYYLGINRTREENMKEPTQADNVKFFVQYQVNWMYLRYFIWNFAGKQNDNQGLFLQEMCEMETGISGLPIDNLIYGDQQQCLTA